MIRNIKLRNKGIAKLLNLNIFAIVLSDRNGGINDVGDGHHNGLYSLLKLSLLGLASGKLLTLGTADELKAQAGTEHFEDAFVAIVKGGAR